ncbi:MAG: hypothetical protein L0Z53_08660 [Acidobacteriales bacterium]|nr:hypothetical protein [Terriglobales bacterium]
MRLKVMTTSLWITRIFLGGLALYWLVMLKNLLFAYLEGGSKGFRDYVAYVATWDATYFPETKDPLLAVHSAYQRWIFYILLAWLLRELHGYLLKRVRSAKTASLPETFAGN